MFGWPGGEIGDPSVNMIKAFFSFSLTVGRNKLECLSLGNFFSEEDETGALGQFPCLIYKY